MNIFVFQSLARNIAMSCYAIVLCILSHVSDMMRCTFFAGFGDLHPYTIAVKSPLVAEIYQFLVVVMPLHLRTYLVD